MRRFPLRVVINPGWTGGSGLRSDGDSSDPRPRKGFSNRYNAYGTGTSWRFGNRYTGTM